MRPDSNVYPCLALLSAGKSVIFVRSTSQNKVLAGLNVVRKWLLLRDYAGIGSGITVPAMILIIDDDPEFQGRAQIALAAVHSHGILFADTGKRALELLGDEIAIALIDLNLPDINGFELIAIISRKYPKLRLIAASAYGSHDTLDSAKIMGGLVPIFETTG